MAYLAELVPNCKNKRIILHAILSTLRLAARQARRSISNRPQVANLPHWVLDQAMRPGTTTPPDSKDRLFMKLGTRSAPQIAFIEAHFLARRCLYLRFTRPL